MLEKDRRMIGLLMTVLIIVVILSACSESTQQVLESKTLPEKENTYTVSGYVCDGSYPYGKNVGIAKASVTYKETTVYTDAAGKFTIQVSGNKDPELTIQAPDFHPYKQKPSQMINGGFHLIPEEIYRGVFLVVWNRESSNQNNYLRKWEKQTEFVVVKAGATEEQVNKILSLLATDEYRKMTGGRFTSSGSIKVVDRAPGPNERDGKTVISLAKNIIEGGIAHSEDRKGIINYAEITWNTSQKIDEAVFWHEMFHTVTAGGHINEWPSVVSERDTTGYATPKDEKILNCIYNSPPMRKPDN